MRSAEVTTGAGAARSDIGSLWGWTGVVSLPLVTVDLFDVVFLVVALSLGESVGLGGGTLALLYAVRLLGGGAVALGAGSLAHRSLRARWTVMVEGAVAWSAAAALAAFAGSTSSLLLVLLVAGAGTAAAKALHPGLVTEPGIDDPSGLLGAAVVHHAARMLGLVVAGVLLALLTAVGDLTWRVVLLAAGQVGLVATAAALWRNGRTGPPPEAPAPAAADAEDLPLGVFESTNRLWQIPSVKLMMFGSGLAAAVALPFVSYLPRLLTQDRELGAGAVAALIVTLGVAGFAGAMAAGRLAGDRAEPRPLLDLAVRLLLAAGVAWAVGTALPAAALVAVLAVSFALVTGAAVVTTAALLAVVHPSLRTSATSLQALAAAFGGLAGLFGSGGLSASVGGGGGTGLLLAVAGALVLRTSAARVGRDVELLERQVAEERQLRGGSATERPLLACRGVDFAYGQQQILFDVDFTIREGEMVALLGTNGAGKSTLLRAISGLGYPTAGSIRLRGSDITYVGAERRARLGIVQVLGGRAVFGPLSVVQNLRLFAYSLGRQKTEVDAGLERTWAMFPKLHELRNQPAATMSGGQQQMLALSRSFILEPQLLLIDELSLGLAPKVVEELLGAVRRINDAGTAVVLVEQSVNIALSVVKHAYFMEKGEIRFDGAADELLGRSDLLRSVFLGGAAGASPPTSPAAPGNGTALVRSAR